jgi:hypothetical protein
LDLKIQVRVIGLGVVRFDLSQYGDGQIARTPNTLLR